MSIFLLNMRCNFVARVTPALATMQATHMYAARTYFLQTAHCGPPKAKSHRCFFPKVGSDYVTGPKQLCDWAKAKWNEAKDQLWRGQVKASDGHSD
jgi:hypothetical protein